MIASRQNDKIIFHSSMHHFRKLVLPVQQAHLKFFHPPWVRALVRNEPAQPGSVVGIPRPDRRIQDLQIVAMAGKAAPLSSYVWIQQGDEPNRQAEVKQRDNYSSRLVSPAQQPALTRTAERAYTGRRPDRFSAKRAN